MRLLGTSERKAVKDLRVLSGTSNEGKVINIYEKVSGCKAL